MIVNEEHGPAGQAQQRLEVALAPVRERLGTHPLYAYLCDEWSVRLFMQAHVFAVWDFQSLLKALQRAMTCVEVPWVPTADPQARRLVNEIVLDEESDHAPGGGYLSHFEMYLQAMRECAADTEPIGTVVGRVGSGTSVEEALGAPGLPTGVRAFVTATMAIARSGQPHRVAAAFAYGREEVIPAMFRQLVERLATLSPGSWTGLRHYLDRHIGKDADEHGPQARLLVRKLCGSDEALWSEATEVARSSLEARCHLWDAIAASVAGARQNAASNKPTERAAIRR